MSEIDITAFEAQFEGERLSKDMDNVTFERVAYLNDRIGDLESLNEMREGMIKHLDDEIDDINGYIAELMNLLVELRCERDPMVEEKNALKREIRPDNEKLEALKRELSRLLEEIAARQRLRRERALIDEKTIDAPWRERALPHQIDGAHFLTSALRAICGDKPGLGKTLESIMTIDLLRAKGKANKVLIFTPKPVLKDFEREIHRWSPRQFVHVLDHVGKGMKNVALEIIQHIPKGILLTNYEVWRKDKSIIEMLKQCQFDTIILDEAHNLKTWKSSTTQGIRDIVYAENKCPKCGHGFIDGADNKFRLIKTCGACEYRSREFGEWCSIESVIPMTGTPILNKPQELFPLLNLIDREGFPSEKDFLRDFCTQQFDYNNERYYWTFGNGGSERMLKKLGMRYIARTRETAGVIMPPQEVKHHWLELDEEKYPRQSEFVRQLRGRARLVFSEDEQLTQNHVLAWYQRMRQAASWPDGIKIKGCPHDPICLDEDGIEKCRDPQIIFPRPGTPPIGESVLMDAAEEIVREAVEAGDRIVVFCMFRAGIDEMMRRCESAGIRAGKLVGGMTDVARQEIVDDFNANRTKVGEHKYDVMVAQYQTASVGLNLHGAQQLLCLEREWSPGKEEQTLDRLRRIDSLYSSTVHILHAEGTATDLIDDLIAQKEAMLGDFESQVNIREAMRKWLDGDEKQ